MIIKKPLKRLFYSAVSDLSNIDFINQCRITILFLPLSINQYNFCNVLLLQITPNKDT